MSARVIGVDLGGTQIRAVVADLNGKIFNRKATLTLAEEGPDAVIERVQEQILLAADGKPFDAIGIGAPGPTDPFAGLVLMGPNLPGWDHVPLRDVLADHFQVPVFLGNDANLAGLAEHHYGAGRGVAHMIYITVSTGIGGGVIVNNRMLLGHRGLAGEIGHITLDIQVEHQAPGVVGTLEGMASGPNIARRAQRALVSGVPSSVLTRVGDDILAVTPKLLKEEADKGDSFAFEQFRIAGRYLGLGVTSLLHVFNPQRIVIGGSIWTYCHTYMADAMWEVIRQRTKSAAYWEELTIVTAELGDDVGLLGAVALAIDGLDGQVNIYGGS
jgi:glucokinase